MLDWSTDDLARLTSITANSLNKIERGHVTPHETVLKKIQTTFENYGIEFLPGSGLMRKEKIITILKGEKACDEMRADIHESLKDIGGEVLVAFADEAVLAQILRPDFLSAPSLKHNISYRVLCAGNSPLRMPEISPCIQQLIPAEYFSTSPFLIYGPKIAFFSTSLEIVLIEDERCVESLKCLFDYAWRLSRAIPSKARSPKKTKRRK